MHSATVVISLPLARYRLDFTVTTPLTLPAFAGSTLRGAFGGALRASACMTKAKSCDGCPLLASCPYAVVFEPRPPSAEHPLQDFNQIPRAYVIEPPQWGEKTYAPGETLSFHLVLAGRVVEQLPLILWAFHKGFERSVGRGDGTATLTQVWHVIGKDATPILDGPGGNIARHATTVPPVPDFAGDAVTLHFDSPLRLQTNGRRATAEEFTPRKLLMRLVGRIALIHEFHGAGPLPLNFKALAAQAETLGSDKQLKWRDWSRYSSRQQQKIDLGGVIGSWRLTGEIAPFIPFLYLGQWLHVGKEATFGLGGYRLEFPSGA
ncbi:CRISPR system precrRNA processing endoribonuclease RAMP protein Cas6 [Zoogloea sp.]|uniref:CRISPR system precrRNA processing endoribonuclease RAMP protein Cas6 n=1 Tax=Zoogloea sp. TaxID=49181 RepID=UPI0035B3EFDB